MAITRAALTSGSDGTDKTAGQSYSTASITPTANRLVLAAVWLTGDNAGGTQAAATLSGNGLTWVEIDRQECATGEFRGQVILFRAMGASPSAGAVTITVDGLVPSAGWSVNEFDGVDTSGTNGSGAIVQTAKAGSSGNGTTATVSLASGAGAADNRPFAVSGLNTNQVMTERASWTELHDQAVTVPNGRLQTQWRSDTFEQTASSTWVSNSRWAIIAAEIKAAGGAGATPIDGDALDLKWDLAAQVDGGALDVVFDTRSAVDGGALDAVWDLRATVDGQPLDLVWDVGGLTPVNGSPLDLVWDVVGEAKQGGIVRGPVEVVPSGVNAPRLRLVWDVEPVDAGTRRRLADLVRPPAPERAEDAAEPESRRARRRRARRLRRRSSVEAAPLRLYWDTVSSVEGDPAWLFSDVAVPGDGAPLVIGWEIRVPPSETEDLRDIVDVLMLLS